MIHEKHACFLLEDCARRLVGTFVFVLYVGRIRNTHRVKNSRRTTLITWRSSAGLLLAAGLALSGCSSIANRITGFGQNGFARFIDASPATTTTGIALEADGGVINSGISSATP